MSLLVVALLQLFDRVKEVADYIVEGHIWPVFSVLQPTPSLHRNPDRGVAFGHIGDVCAYAYIPIPKTIRYAQHNRDKTLIMRAYIGARGW